MITKMLDLSTGHVTKKTADILDNTPEGQIEAFRHVQHDHGWIIFVTETEDKEYEDYSELKPIMEYACKEGCMLIKFDADGEVDEQFPTFEW